MYDDHMLIVRKDMIKIITLKKTLSKLIVMKDLSAKKKLWGLIIDINVYLKI